MLLYTWSSCRWQVFSVNKVLMYFKILVVFAFILHIYSHLCKATNLYRLFTIILYWSKATFMVYVKKLYIYIYISYIYYIYIIHIYTYIYIIYMIYCIYIYIHNKSYHIYIYIYISINCVLVLVLYFYVILFHFDNFWVSWFGVHLVRTQKVSEDLTLFLNSRERTNRARQLINNYVHTRWMAHCVEVYMQFWSCFKVWLKRIFFYMKDFTCNYNLIHPTFFHWLL